MNWKVIVNPVAGRGYSRRIWPRLAEELKRLNVRFTPYFTRCAGDGVAAARVAAAEGFDGVVAVGGDGTVAEVVNGLAAGEGRPDSPLVLGVLPVGTGNDFVRSLAIPADPVAGCRLLVKGIARRVDVGLVDGRRFVNVAGVGFDAEVARKSNTGVRFLRGSAAYIYGILTTFLTFVPAPVRVEVDGVTRWEDQAMMVAVANGRYYAGGLFISPPSRIDDGRLDVCVIEGMGRVEFLRAFRKVFDGRHLELPKVHVFSGQTVRISQPAAVRQAYIVHADGEILGPLPQQFSLAPGALRVQIPEGATREK